MPVITRITCRRETEILQASRTRTGWQNTESPILRQSQAEKKPIVDAIRSSFEDKPPIKEQNGHNAVNGSNNTSALDAKGRLENRRMGAKVSAIANIFQSLSPTPGSPNPPAYPVVNSPVLGEKPIPTPRSESSLNRHSATDKSNGVKSSAAAPAVSSAIINNKINITPSTPPVAAAPLKSRLSPKQGRRLATEKKENTINGSEMKSTKLNANGLSGVKVNRSESRVSRFNNARAVFEKLQTDKVCPEKFDVNCAKSQLSRPSSMYTSLEVEESPKTVSKLMSSSLNGSLDTHSSNGNKENGSDAADYLLKSKLIETEVISARKVTTVQSTRLSSEQTPFRAQPPLPSGAEFKEPERPVTAIKKEVTTYIRSQSVDSRANGRPAARTVERSQTGDKPQSPLRRTSSLSAKEELLDKIVSELEEDTMASKVNDLKIDDLADLNLCDTSGIPDTLDFDECFQGVELMTEEEAEKLLSRSTWPDLLSGPVGKGRDSSQVSSNSKPVSSRSGSLSSEPELAPIVQNGPAKPDRLPNIPTEETDSNRASRVERPTFELQNQTPFNAVNSPTTPEERIVAAKGIEQSLEEIKLIVQPPGLTREIPKAEKPTTPVEVKATVEEDEPEAEEDQLNETMESSVTIDDVEYIVFYDGHYCLDTPGLPENSDNEEDSVTMFLCPVPARKKSRLRFSKGPIKCYSTHAAEDYDRRNEDVDPVAASAEYELEKRIEKMDVFPVELEKGPDGLGLSIIGMGVGADAGLEKLGIFVKTITENGAAFYDARIQVNDQIIEVDGKSLVGVTQAYAASVLRSTSGRVNFLIGREKDVANSEIAQLISQSIQAEQQREHDYAQYDQAPNKALPREPEPLEDLQEGQCDSLSETVELSESLSTSHTNGKPAGECPSYQAIEEKMNDLQTMNLELTEWKSKYSFLSEQLSHVKYEADNNAKQAQLQLDEMKQRLVHSESTLGSARKEIENYQRLLDDTKAQYTIIEKKYHKAKKLIKGFQQRDAGCVTKDSPLSPIRDFP
ncbi:Neurabin-2 [Halotydeus destructor]|nr:Neurabin-2 [Halotydeus destructor]